jgi:hypothetical protein
LNKTNNSKRLTRVEVIIIIFACLFFALVVQLTCRKVRSIAYRMVCGNHLSLIGMSMLLYNNEYKELPRAGDEGCLWTGQIKNWKGPTRLEAYGTSPGAASITSCFYLLIKYAEIIPNELICPSDSGIKQWNPLEDNVAGITHKDIMDFWDFGANPRTHCSYAYQMPFSEFKLTTSGDPGLAIAADRNPWIAGPKGKVRKDADFKEFNPAGSRQDTIKGNTLCHEVGQNVLYLDGHESFERVSFCGVKGDNIYTFQQDNDIRIGTRPVPNNSLITKPANKTDSILVNDGPIEGK